MRFPWTRRFLVPGMLRRKLFVVCTVAALFPWLGFLGWQAWNGTFDVPGTLVLLIASLAGAGAGIWAVERLLAPLGADAGTPAGIDQVQPGKTVARDGRELMAQLIARVNRAATAAPEITGQPDDAAHRDLLTGLWNRRGFLARVGPVTDGYRDNVIALIDLDYFSRLNDRHGTPAGDDVLRMFAHRLVGGLRRGDLIARWGGGAFVVVLAGASVGEAAAILERFAAAMRAERVGALGGEQITFSAGVAPMLPDSLDMAIARADDALYRAKRGGRDRIEPVFALGNP